MENIEIKQLRYPKLAKCSSCHRVRDIYYKAMIYDVEDNSSVVGDLDLCKLCGENLNHAVNGRDAENPGGKIIKTFNFKK